MNLNKKRFHLEITGECNINCKYCYNSDFNNTNNIRNQLSLEEIKILIRQATDIGCSTFIFSGGEPFLNSNIIEIFKCCPENSKVSAITNATLLNQDIIDKLKDIKQLTELKISWDGFKSHDMIRRGSTHKQVLEAIKLIQNNLSNCKIIINTMVNKYSITELLDLYKTLKELNIKHWRIDMPFNSGRYTLNREDLSNVDFENIISVYKKLLIEYFKDKKPMILEIFNVYKSQIATDTYFEFDLDAHPCAYYNNTITVRPNGDITFCPSLGFPIGNWRTTKNLEETVRSSYKHKYMNVSLRELNTCKECRYFKLCGGGCRADAVTWLENEYEVDPISCSIMPLIEKEIVPILPNEEKQIIKNLINSKGVYPSSKKNVLELL